MINIFNSWEEYSRPFIFGFNRKISLEESQYWKTCVPFDAEQEEATAKRQLNVLYIFQSQSGNSEQIFSFNMTQKINNHSKEI